MNNSPAQQLMYSRESPLDPRTWDMSAAYVSQSGVSGKNTPTPDGAGTASGTPPTMPHQVSDLSHTRCAMEIKMTFVMKL